VIWHPPDDIEFVTSDNPLVTFIPLLHGPFAPGYGFKVPGVVAAFPLSSNACLMMDLEARAQSRVDVETVRKLSGVIVQLCDRYVYSKTYSGKLQCVVAEQAGTARYGGTAFTQAGLKMPSVKEFMRERLGER
jgi:Protein of unknown function (DUF4238)